MPKPSAMTVRLTPELSEKLDALARETKRSKSDLGLRNIYQCVVSKPRPELLRILGGGDFAQIFDQREDAV